MTTVLLADGRRLADVTEAVGATTLDFTVGSVAELTMDAVDTGRLLPAGLLTAGTTLTYDGAPWEVAAVERDYRGTATLCVFTARSRLARRLRNTMGPSTTKGITPAAWIVKAVKKAGGSALVQPGAKRRVIHQKRAESVLDVISNLSGDMGTEFVEFSNRLIVGTGWWALNGGPGLPLWPVDVDGPECLSFSARTSLDDRDQAATASLTVPHELGSQLRPWHRVTIGGRVDDDDKGVWLVQDVSYGLHESQTPTIGLYRPRKSAVVAKGSSSTGTGTGDPIPGSSYTDAPRPRGWAGRSVDRILADYNAHRGGYPGHAIYRGCLYYAQQVAGYTHVGDHPKDLWYNDLAASKKHANRNVVPGAVVLYSNGGVGHAVVYLGGGRSLSTDYPSSGRWSIGPADEIERAFGTLLGWYSPP